MKTFIATIALVLAMSFGTAQAAQLTIEGGLTPEQEAQLQLQAAQMAAQNKGTPVSPDELTEWVHFGTAIGQGLAGTAKELGIAADEIAKTTVGMFAMIIIAWHFMGEELISILFGFGWLTIMIPLWVYFYRRQFIIEAVTRYEKGKHVHGLTKEVIFRKREVDGNGDCPDDGLRFFYWLTLLIISVVGIFPILL